MTVVDASVLVTALVDDGEAGSAARRRLLGVELDAPHLVDIEVVSALRALRHRRRVDLVRAHEAVDLLAELPLARHGHTPLLARIWALAGSLTAYDAAYVALAEALDSTLLTGDRRLAERARRWCAVELI